MLCKHQKRLSNLVYHDPCPSTNMSVIMVRAESELNAQCKSPNGGKQDVHSNVNLLGRMRRHAFTEPYSIWWGNWAVDWGWGGVHTFFGIGDMTDIFGACGKCTSFQGEIEQVSHNWSDCCCCGFEHMGWNSFRPTGLCDILGLKEWLDLLLSTQEMLTTRIRDYFDWLNISRR